MNFSKVIAKTLKDILRPKVLGFIVMVGLISTVVWIAILWIFWNPFEKLVSSYLATFPLIGSFSWFQTSGALLSALIVGYTLILITISSLSSLLSEKLLIKLAKDNYPDIKIIKGSKLHLSLYYTLKANLIFLILFLFTFPLIFIPIFGQLWILWLWSISLKDPTLYDVGSLFISDESELKRVSKRARLVALIASTFNYIPLLHIFAPLFAQILFLHYLLSNKHP